MAKQVLEPPTHFPQPFHLSFRIPLKSSPPPRIETLKKININWKYNPSRHFDINKFTFL